MAAAAGVVVTKGDISTSHRVGRLGNARAGKPRPIVARFVRWDTRTGIFCNEGVQDRVTGITYQQMTIAPTTDRSLSSKGLEECCIAWRKGARRIFNMSYQTHSFLVGPLSGQRSIDEMLYRKILKFVYSVMNSNNSIVAHIGQLIRQSAKLPIGGNVACFRYKFGIDVDDNVLKNIRLISRYFELNGERNITASIAIDLQSMIEDNHVGFTRDELSYMLNNVCTT